MPAFRRSAAIAHELQQELEHVDEVQVERQRTQHDRLADEIGAGDLRVGFLERCVS
jgi:uncharacterized membrane protein